MRRERALELGGVEAAIENSVGVKALLRDPALLAANIPVVDRQNEPTVGLEYACERRNEGLACRRRWDMLEHLRAQREIEDTVREREPAHVALDQLQRRRVGEVELHQPFPGEIQCEDLCRGAEHRRREPDAAARIERAVTA